MDNTKCRFSSAAEALNYGGTKAREEHLLFAHQDINLSSKTWLEESEKILDSIEDLGIAGVAGRSQSELGTISNIEHGIPPRWGEGDEWQRDLPSREGTDLGRMPGDDTSIRI